MKRNDHQDTQAKTLTMPSLEANGLNTLFQFRNDEPVLYDDALKGELGTVLNPDKIIGLRETHTLEEYLRDDAAHELQGSGVTLQTWEVLDPPPYKRPLKPRDDHLLFPFLIMEAKAGATGASWRDIRLQTAFPIKALLDAQNSLIRAGARGHGLRPLVWFVYNRGEEWRVSAAFIHENRTKKKAAGRPEYVSLFAGILVCISY